MDQQTRTRAAVAMFVYILANAVLVAAGLISVAMAGPHAGLWIPLVIAGVFLVAAPFAVDIAPRPRPSDWRRPALQPMALRVQSSRVRR